MTMTSTCAVLSPGPGLTATVWNIASCCGRGKGNTPYSDALHVTCQTHKATVNSNGAEGELETSGEQYS